MPPKKPDKQPTKSFSILNFFRSGASSAAGGEPSQPTTKRGSTSASDSRTRQLDARGEASPLKRSNAQEGPGSASDPVVISDDEQGPPAKRRRAAEPDNDIQLMEGSVQSGKGSRKNSETAEDDSTGSACPICQSPLTAGPSVSGRSMNLQLTSRQRLMSMHVWIGGP